MPISSTVAISSNVCLTLGGDGSHGGTLHVGGIVYIITVICVPGGYKITIVGSDGTIQVIFAHGPLNCNAITFLNVLLAGVLYNITIVNDGFCCSSLSSFSGISNQCCPDIPLVLRATFAGGCPGLSGLVVTLTYDPPTLSWIGFYTGPNGGLSKLVLICIGTIPVGGHWTIQSSWANPPTLPVGCDFTAASPVAYSCDPIDIQFDIPASGITGCCAGSSTLQIVVSL